MTQKLLLALPAALSLAACGGGGGDEATTAPAQAQYSLTTSAPNWTTTLPANLSVYAEQDGTNVTSSQKITNVEFKQWNATRVGHDQIDIQIDGEIITLTWDANDRLHYGTHDGRTYAYIGNSITDGHPNAPETVVDLFYVIAENSTNTAIIDDIAAGVVGFETPDAVVAAATGTAKYSGSGSMVYLAPNAWEISGLQANFNVDFNTSTISGAIKVDDPYISGQQQPANTYNFATISVPTTALTGNGFSAQPTVTVLNPGTNTYTFSNQTINGSFYGDSSDVLAGTLSTDYTVNGTAGVAVGTYWTR
ncbi:transferrin-binding protein-like solute binding protein [Planktomarina temperata]|nr:transferrin-binding protein-like solute binding protein [Planktomarina temperata]